MPGDPPSYVWASSLDSDQKCPAKMVTSAGEARDTHETTEMGSAFHKLMEIRATGSGDVMDQERIEVIPSLAKEFGVPETGLAYLARNFTWKPEDTPRLQELHIEARLQSSLIHGKADVIMVYQLLDGTVVLEVVDYKSGDPEYGLDAQDSMQVKWYAAKATENYPNVDVVKGSIAYVQNGDEGWSQYTLRPGEVESILERGSEIARASLAQWALPPDKRSYCRGAHCQWCAGRYNCPIFKRFIRTVREDPAALMETEDKVTLYQEAHALVVAASTVKDLCKQYAKQRGPQKSADGQWVLEERSNAQALGLSERIVKDALEQAGISEDLQTLVMFFIKNRPQDTVTKCQPYKVKRKRGKRSEA